MVAAPTRELIYRPTLEGWTPDRVRRARNSADGGSMLELADLVDTIMTDDRVSGVLSTRTHGLLGLPLEFTGGDKQAIAELQGTPDEPGEWWSMHDESETAKLLSWGLLCGIGLAQRIELPRLLGQPHRYRIETWSPRWLTYYHQAVSGSHWHVLTEEGMQPIFPGDGQWILFMPYGARRPWAEGLYKALVIPWLFKHFAREDRANYSEVLGSPIRVGYTGEGGTEKQRTKFINQLRYLGKSGSFVLPKGWDLKLVEATGKSYEIYDGTVKDSNEAMVIVLAGQTVTTEGTTGFSSGNIHDQIKQDLIRFDAQRLSGCLRKQSLEPWALWNYGWRNAAPRPKWDTQKPADTADEAVGLKAFGDAIASLDGALDRHGLQVDVEKLVAKFDIPVKKKPAPTPNALRRRAKRA
jgi:hypothetical protein